MKKIISALLTASMLLGLFSAPNVYAMEYQDGDGTATLTVTVDTRSNDISSSYIVSYPASLELSLNSENGKYEGLYVVNVRGTLATGYHIYISYGDSLVLRNVDNAADTVQASVHQFKDKFYKSEINDDTFVQTTGLVSASIDTSAKYSGTLTFNYGLALDE